MRHFEELMVILKGFEGGLPISFLFAAGLALCQWHTQSWLTEKVKYIRILLKNSMFKPHRYKQPVLAELEPLQCYLCLALTPLESSVVVARMYLVYQNSPLPRTFSNFMLPMAVTQVYPEIDRHQSRWLEDQWTGSVLKQDKKTRKAGVPFKKFKNLPHLGLQVVHNTPSINRA